jgi:hypothetical protein
MFFFLAMMVVIIREGSDASAVAGLAFMAICEFVIETFVTVNLLTAYFQGITPC